MTAWLTTVAWFAIALGMLSALVILADILAGHRQHMAVMNVVWPVTGLYAGPLAAVGVLRARPALDAPGDAGGEGAGRGAAGEAEAVLAVGRRWPPPTAGPAAPSATCSSRAWFCRSCRSRCSDTTSSGRG